MTTTVLGRNVYSVRSLNGMIVLLLELILRRWLSCSLVEWRGYFYNGNSAKTQRISYNSARFPIVLSDSRIESLQPKDELPSKL
jgi:hypothetical protein